MGAPPAGLRPAAVGLPQVRGEAVLSDDGVYRYELRRIWDIQRPTVAWVMLNPSKATATEPDATITRIIGYSSAWGYGTLIVVNLFAMRTTTPGNLWLHPRPVGPLNGVYLENVLSARSITTVVCAWGGSQASKPAFRKERDRFLMRAAQVGRSLHALRLCATGDPVHPVRQPRAQPLRVWRNELGERVEPW